MDKYFCTRTWLLLCLLSFLDLGEAEFTCTEAGKFPDIQDSRKYYECHFVGDNTYISLIQTCPLDNCFDRIRSDCVFSPECPIPQDATLPPVISFTCPSVGKFPHVDPSRKGEFYECLNVHGRLVYYEYKCLPVKPCFNVNKQACQIC